MRRGELKQIGGIGDLTYVRLSQDHGIETIAQLAALSDTEAADLQRALQAAGRRLPGGEVARWRDQARQLAGESPAPADEPLATFVVEAWPPAGGPGDGAARRAAPLRGSPHRIGSDAGNVGAHVGHRRRVSLDTGPGERARPPAP